MAAITHGCAIITTAPEDELPGSPHPLLATRAFPLSEFGEGDGGEVSLRNLPCYLIPPNAPDALAIAISELGARPDLRQHLGEGARKLAENFTWESIAARTAAFFAQIIGSNSR